ncbi:MAG TPA: Holliday junction resolvase RuvX [Coriobacteriia bacterium]|nr:Holliday junction resolvase RuvX [Coriobacteriia bacterium]
MRVLALDIGSRRIGVAMSDADGTVASPLMVLDAGAYAPRRVGELVAEHGVGLVVVGLPLTLGGEEGPQAAAVRRSAAEIAGHIGVPITYYDERLTSAEAHKAMAPGVSSRERRGLVDKVAAAMLLQAFLDSRRAGACTDDDIKEQDDHQS